MISSAWATDATGIAGGMDVSALLMNVLPLVLIFLVFYMFVIRPQLQQGKAQAELVKALKKGDVVMTDGGMMGEVTAVKDAFVQVKVGPGTVVTVAKEAVRNVLTGEVAKDVEKAVKS